LAEQDDLVEAFRKGEDVYKIMASAIYNKPREKVTTQERFVGKTTVLGCGYGMGKDKFKAQLKVFGVDITIDNAAHIVDTYRRVYPKIPELWRQADNVLRIMYEGKYTAPLGKDEVFQVNPLLGGIVSPNGMVIKYLGLSKRIENNLIKFVYQTRTGMMNIYGGKVIENVVQHLARCVIGEQMLKISKRYRVVFTVHDAIACIAPEAEAEEARAHVEECMRYTPTWAEGLPLACESGVGKNYGEC
jgi:DNA polymerase